MNPFDIGPLTNTAFFLLHPLSVDFDKFEKNGFQNAYLGDEDHMIEIEDEQYLIYCLFRPENDYQFEKMLDELEKREIVVDDYDYEEGFCVIVLKFPKDYNPDFRMVVESRYSETSDKFKKLFRMEQACTPYLENKKMVYTTPTTYNKIFNRLPEMRDAIEDYFGVVLDDNQEYWPEFGEKPQILCIDNILDKLKSGA